MLITLYNISQHRCVSVRKLRRYGLRGLSGGVLLYPLLALCNRVNKILHRFRILGYIVLGRKIRGIRNFAALTAYGGKYISLAGFDKFSGGWLEQRYVVALAAGEGPGHHVELHRGVHAGIPSGDDAVLPHDVFKSHLGHASGSAADDGFSPD